MRIITFVALAGTLAAGPAFAQGAAPSPRTTAPCPLHLATLSLSPAQDSAFAAIRDAHRAQMHAMHKGAGMPHQAAGDSARRHDPAHHAQHMAQHAPMHAAMQASMQRALAEARAVLTPVQLATFDAAAKAHDEERKARMSAGGTHHCADCCSEHERMHQQHHGSAKQDG